MSYSSRDQSCPSEVTVKIIQVLETASTKGSAVCHICRMIRRRCSMNRWTVRGKLSPLITPEDLAPKGTARAPARSCYHLQWEGLAHPLLTLCLWSISLYSSGCSQCIRVIKEVFLQEMSLFTAKEALFLHWQWTELCFLHLRLVMADSLRFGCSYWVQDRGWMEEVSGLYPFPRVTVSHLCLFGTAL